jgi:hypothetical protein
VSDLTWGNAFSAMLEKSVGHRILFTSMGGPPFCGERFF